MSVLCLNSNNSSTTFPFCKKEWKSNAPLYVLNFTPNPLPPLSRCHFLPCSLSPLIFQPSPFPPGNYCTVPNAEKQSRQDGVMTQAGIQHRIKAKTKTNRDLLSRLRWLSSCCLFDDSGCTAPKLFLNILQNFSVAEYFHHS